MNGYSAHKMTKSNNQIDVNRALSKAIERKSVKHVSFHNDIEQPANARHKKPHLQANMACQKQAVWED